MSKQKAGDLTTITGNHHSRYSRNMKRTTEKITGGAFTKNKDATANPQLFSVAIAIVTLGVLFLVGSIVGIVVILAGVMQ